MRLFDLTGVAMVASWLVLTGLYVYRHEFRTDSQTTDATQLDEEVLLQEGDNWLLLRRHDEDVGFVHRTRTRLEQGWLMEYELLLVLKLLGKRRPIDVSIKARLDSEAQLREFDADIEAAGRTISAQGDVHTDPKSNAPYSLSLVINPGASPIQKTVALEARPRLASHSFHQILAREDLEPGDRFKNDYFDPTSLGMQTIVMEYIGRETVDVYGTRRQAIHIEQHVAGNTYDVYLDEGGELVVQEFPLEMVGAQVEPSLGRSRAASLRNQADKLASSRDGSTPAPLEGAGMRTALEMLGIGSDSLMPSPERPDTSPPSPDIGPGEPR